jgi:hypothetical protein
MYIHSTEEYAFFAVVGIGLQQRINLRYEVFFTPRMDTAQLSGLPPPPRLRLCIWPDLIGAGVAVLQYLTVYKSCLSIFYSMIC